VDPAFALPVTDLEDLNKKRDPFQLGEIGWKTARNLCNCSSASRDFQGNVTLQEMSFGQCLALMHDLIDNIGTKRNGCEWTKN